MKKSHIILTAVILYLIIMVMGGAAYYAYSVQHQAHEARIEQEEQAAAAQRKQEREENAAKVDKEEKPEEAVKKKVQQEGDSIQRETRGGVEYYKHYWPSKLPTGVYLRPFLAEGNGVVILKNDIYYSYSIDDPEQTAWIFGDRLDIIAGGQTTTIVLDPSKLRKHMASDASWLSESQVLNADKETLAAYHRIAQAGAATIVYYKLGGKSRRHELGAKEIQRIREMVELYDVLSK